MLRHFLDRLRESASTPTHDPRSDMWAAIYQSGYVPPMRSTC